MKILTKLAAEPTPRVATLMSVCAICTLRTNSVAAQRVAAWVSSGGVGKIRSIVQAGSGRWTTYRSIRGDIEQALINLGVSVRNLEFSNDAPRGGVTGNYITVAQSNIKV